MSASCPPPLGRLDAWPPSPCVRALLRYADEGPGRDSTDREGGLATRSSARQSPPVRARHQAGHGDDCWQPQRGDPARNLTKHPEAGEPEMSKYLVVIEQG